MSHLDLLPTKLSPSRASDYLNCPLKFYYKTIEKLPDPPGEAAFQGTVVHTVLEHIYTLPKEQRTLEAAIDYIPTAWESESSKRQVQELLASDDKMQARILKFAEKMLTNYFNIEPADRFDPVGLEEHVQYQMKDFLMHGYIDRLDAVPDKDGVAQIYISDYKTGRIPTGRFLEKAFYAMQIYAYLYYKTHNVKPRALRLIYLKGTDYSAVKTKEVTDTLLKRAESDINNVWQRIQTSAAKEDWPAKTGPLCNYCPFKPRCPAWQ